MCVPQLKLQLVLKTNEADRMAKAELALKKEIEKEQKHSHELRIQMDALKSTISSLERDIKQLHDVNNEQKVSLWDLLIVLAWQ